MTAARLRLKYGGLRDLIIGMTVVLADGTIAKSGGKVVKNVAGYDLHKLMTGSFGTLGVIAEVNFRLHPVGGALTDVDRGRTERSRQRGTVRAAAPRIDGLADGSVIGAVAHLETGICARRPHRGTGRNASMNMGPAFRRFSVSFPVVGRAQDVWNARQQIFDNKHAVVLKISMLPAEICSISAELHQWSFGDGRDVKALAQATGLMTVALEAAPELRACAR